jgi:hypothetical protein
MSQMGRDEWAGKFIRSLKAKVDDALRDPDSEAPQATPQYVDVDKRATLYWKIWDNGYCWHKAHESKKTVCNLVPDGMFTTKVPPKDEKHCAVCFAPELEELELELEPDGEGDTEAPFRYKAVVTYYLDVWEYPPVDEPKPEAIEHLQEIVNRATANTGALAVGVRITTKAVSVALEEE